MTQLPLFVSQILFATGIAIVLFESIVKPHFVAQIGIRRWHRWGSTSSIVVFLAVPFLAHLHGTGVPLIATSFALLFVLQASANAVRACSQHRRARKLDL